MSTFQLGDVIAERRLDVQDGTGITREVVVLIGKPMPDIRPGGDWYCPFQIIGLEDDSIQAAFAVDSVQALLLGLQMAGAQLKYYQTVKKYILTWLDQESLGFPLA
jgi:hypothetical protein